ncbi:hypothetical protein OG884_20730 [Streptosporangium sp. NBC_01755]|uniref:hypothetical protein n=1 Tax=Streptosporangium sp. NBC_01755 TaxID=2975949 RepID=UPI002DDBED62|nr:hypothetical protein [Streptosporangium sp. NBC_01755]WSC97323.1 hypothetical protein OG884_20730 [Streptosporangium sp. NBC_01755]
MIAAVACVPQAPLLLPGLTGGRVAEVEEIRLAARAAVEAVVGQGVDEVVVVGGTPCTRTYPVDAPAPSGRLAPASGRLPRDGSLPVSLAVGRLLLAESPVPRDARTSTPPTRSVGTTPRWAKRSLPFP